jgi:hypothetical protein
MTNSLKSDTSSDSQAADAQPSGWVKLGAIAAASALAGGLAAAWWYRKTLRKFHQAEENPSNPHFGIPKDDPADDA